MFSKLIDSKKRADKERAKKLILNEIFKSSVHKKAVLKAARESAKDQREVVSRYNNKIKSLSL